MKNIRVIIPSLLVLVFSLYLSPTITANDARPEAVKQVVTKINVNSASVAELAEKLEGVGTEKAQLIVEHREKHGPFTSVEQLLDVKGIGAATLKKNRDKIQL
ncbi:helix-hairpin-helix domain-containing protein [Microbulbifer sp. 2205BS26-8]|uniref:ComEA family DNA-binding protein n=1 Tax=Microbulbifer sp. 2205BS26-8 TaxID=3064386 RepID=UPI00273D96F9|nr:helix-hairpin-helix domain-containing protein [Microbulbifer sp. 2205BS26-8]MDP5209722.1 helix-hairpin-helix domain-containing protein [Microbulbifer sp. 2205BS26-8]